MSSDEAMKAAVKTTFEQHQNEIKRRSEISRRGMIDDKTFAKVECSKQFDFENRDHKFIVFSLSQSKFAPIPVDESNPAICLYGGFPTYEEALEYAKECVMQEHPTFSVFVDTAHKWTVAVSEPAHLTEKYTESHVKALLEEHDKILHMNLKEFEENVAEQKAGSSQSKGSTAQEDEAKKENPKARSHKVSNRLDLRGQKIAVVSFVKDSSPCKEFIFKVYGFFDHEDDANTYIRNTCGDSVENFDLDVVGTCEWVFPQSMTHENATNEVFRSEELDKIMRNHRNQPKEVAKFKEAMKDDERLQE